MATPPRPQREDLPRVLFWGTYDLSKPRTRILIAGLREHGVQVDECHASIWEDVRDKGTLRPSTIARRLVRAGVSYPRLIAQFLRGQAPDVVVIGYLGQLDVILLFPFARLRGVPVVWDQFISLYDTVVSDRQKLSRKHLLARALYVWEWVACRAADRVLMDTREHARYVAETFGLGPLMVQSVWVGAETSVFSALPRRPNRSGPLTVLFYGQLIPLHGVDTIIRAARLLENQPVRFVLIGSGQEGALVSQLLSEQPMNNLEWHPWLDYESLNASIGSADVCLGIFGCTAKASRVIPNKVFQIVAADRPLITRDSSAIRELFGDRNEGVRLVPPGDPRALADALLAFAGDREALSRTSHGNRLEDIGPRAIGRQLLDVLQGVRAGVEDRTP